MTDIATTSRTIPCPNWCTDRHTRLGNDLDHGHAVDRIPATGRASAFASCDDGMVVPAVDVMLYGDHFRPATVTVTISEPAQGVDVPHKWADVRLLESEAEALRDALSEALRLLEGGVRP